MEPPKSFSTAIFCILATVIALARPEAESELKPHFLYMKRLREHLSDSHLTIPDSTDRSASVEGKLVATSIETQSTGGIGTSENGFVFNETNQVDLVFTVPKQLREGYPHVELWLFPDKSLTPANRILELSFLFQALVPPATNPRSDQHTILWNTNENCVYLNLTALSKKILKIIQKRMLNESNVRLEVEVTRVEESSQRIENDTLDTARQDLCASLSRRTSNNSFLIIKNYNDSSMPFVMPQSSPTHVVSKRDVAEISLNVSKETTNPCGVVPLVVDLPEVYGNFINAPTVTDIKDCSGRCTLLLDRLAFTKHGEIKERLKLLPGGEALSNFEPCCMPVEFKPLNMLIRLRDKSEVIVQLPDLVVDKCACQ